MSVEVAALGSLFLIVLMVSMDVERHCTNERSGLTMSVGLCALFSSVWLTI